MTYVEEAAREYYSSGYLGDGNQTTLMYVVRGGVTYERFQTLLDELPFTLEEWARYLHLSERTLQRYKKEDKNFDTLQSEKILQISLVYRRGVEVFGKSELFDAWLSTDSLIFGGAKPKDLLDNAFGISLLDEELTRIEHGILA